MTSDYGTVLAETNVRLQKMLAAFDKNDFSAGHNEADEIGALYYPLLFPDDAMAAEKLSNLVKMVASEMYFGGISHQLKQNAIDRAYEARATRFKGE